MNFVSDACRGDAHEECIHDLFEAIFFPEDMALCDCTCHAPERRQPRLRLILGSKQ